MRLRNKKTGEVVYVDFQIPLCNNDETLGSYSVTSLKELNKSFEDYVPAEPIIKATGAQHILKLWASTNHIPSNSNEIEVCLTDSQKGTITQFYSDGLYIHFWGKVAPDAISGRCYTIDELCGEE